MIITRASRVATADKRLQSHEDRPNPVKMLLAQRYIRGKRLVKIQPIAWMICLPIYPRALNKLLATVDPRPVEIFIPTESGSCKL